MDVLIVSSRNEYWQALFPAFASQSLSPVIVPAMDRALGTIRQTPPRLVVLDPDVPQPKGDAADGVREIRSMLSDIFRINAMVHTAVVSVLSGDALHDALEGCGVLLNLPPQPESHDIERMAGALKKVESLQYTAKK